MTQCPKKGSKIVLTDPTYIDSFEKCKTLLVNDPIVQYLDFSKDFILTTDASNFAIGAVLSQGQIGADKPIAYASRTLNTSEINYSTIEKELLAIVWATKYFRPYLFGWKFKIVTDHKPLQWVRLTRWRLKLSEYNFTTVCKQGKLNTNADAFSRVEINNEDANFIAVNVSEKPPSETGSTTLTAHTSAESPILEIPISDEPLNKFHRQISFIVVGDIKNVPTVSNCPRCLTLILKPLYNYQSLNLEKDVIDAIKEYVNLKVKTGILIHPPLSMYSIIPIIQNTFKSSALSMVLTKREVENVKDYLRQQEIIRNYHEGNTVV